MLNVEEGVPPIEPANWLSNPRTMALPPRQGYCRWLAPDTCRRSKLEMRSTHSWKFQISCTLTARLQIRHENVGSQVAGNGRVKWKGPADLLQVFEGGENDDNWDVLGTFIAPPDTVGDVGKDHYVQMFNLLTEIFDKEGNPFSDRSRPAPSLPEWVEIAQSVTMATRSSSMTRRRTAGWCRSSWPLSRTDCVSPFRPAATRPAVTPV